MMNNVWSKSGGNGGAKCPQPAAMTNYLIGDRLRVLTASIVFSRKFWLENCVLLNFEENDVAHIYLPNF